jgi:hypothetical protein
MKAMLLNTLLGICVGRFASIWACAVFVPIVLAEVAYGVLVHDLSASACLRRTAALLITAELAFLFGMFLRPMPDEAS